MGEQSKNPEGRDVESAPWVPGVIQGWSCFEHERTWFTERYARIDGGARTRGSFGRQVLRMLESERGDDALEATMARLHLLELPSAVRSMPVNHLMLICADVACQLSSGNMTLGLKKVAPVLEKQLAGTINALIRKTVPSFAVGNIVEELIKLFSETLTRMLSNRTLVTHTTMGDQHLLALSEENNFLAHLYYASAFHNASGGEKGPFRSVRFTWTAANTGELGFQPRPDPGSGLFFGD